MLILLFNASFALAATSTLAGLGNGIYTFQGNNMNGIAGIQLNIAYNTSLLKNPTVTQGQLVSGAIFAANTTIPGVIIIAIVSPSTFTGDGPIATITFGDWLETRGITSATVSMIDSNGSAVPSSCIITGENQNSDSGLSTVPGLPFSHITQQSDIIQAGQTKTTSQPTYLGSISLPLDPLQQAKSKSEAQTSASSDKEDSVEATVAKRTQYPEMPAADKKTEQSESPQQAKSKSEAQSSAASDQEDPVEATVAERTKNPEMPAADKRTGQSLHKNLYKGILDKFKEYAGKKNLAKMVALFKKENAHVIEQEPTVLLSNGRNKATLKVNLSAKFNSSPSFAVMGGKLVSFRHDKQNKDSWTVVVCPDAGAIRTYLIIIAGAEEFEFPVTVAPVIKTSLTLDERGWSVFTKEIRAKAHPLHDFNNDGVRDFIDEYIFVANYVSKKQVKVLRHNKAL